MTHVPLSFYGRLTGNLRKVARKETDSVLKRLPLEFKARIEGVQILFEDRPGKEDLKKGVLPEAFSVTDREAKTVTIFLINLYDVYAREPGAFRDEFRKLLVRELADWAGVELFLEEL